MSSASLKKQELVQKNDFKKYHDRLTGLLGYDPLVKVVEPKEVKINPKKLSLKEKMARG